MKVEKLIEQFKKLPAGIEITYLDFFPNDEADERGNIDWIGLNKSGSVSIEFPDEEPK